MTAPTRDVPAGVTASVVVALCIAGGIWVGLAGGWWRLAWIPLAALGLICLYGAAESFQKAPRDHKGMRISE